MSVACVNKNYLRDTMERKKKSADSRRFYTDGQEKEWCSFSKEHWKWFPFFFKKKRPNIRKNCCCLFNLTVIHLKCSLFRFCFFTDLPKTSPKILQNAKKHVVVFN